MTEIELLAELIDDIARDLRPEIEPLTGEELAWQAGTALSAQVRTLTSEGLRRPAPGLMDGRLTYYQWIKEFYKGFQAHVGEIMAIKALMKHA